MTHAVYEQATGLFEVLTPLPMRFVGYSGKGVGRNNPNLQEVRNVGPIPRGAYAVSAAFGSETHGPVCFRLTPAEGNAMHGRSGFLIHGDNTRGDASRGCIILSRPARDFLARHSVTTLEVVRFRSKVRIAA